MSLFRFINLLEINSYNSNLIHETKSVFTCAFLKRVESKIWNPVLQQKNNEIFSINAGEFCIVGHWFGSDASKLPIFQWKNIDSLFILLADHNIILHIPKAWDTRFSRVHRGYFSNVFANRNSNMFYRHHF